MSETSTASTFRPWQFFALAALFAATAGVFLSRGTGPANVIFVSAIIGAAALVGTAVYRMLVPLVTPEAVESTDMVGGRTRAALEREKLLVLRSIKELEFDRAMNKISEQDYDDMVARLRARAVRLIRQLDASQSGYRELIERELASRLGRAAASNKGQRTDYPEESSRSQPVAAGFSRPESRGPQRGSRAGVVDPPEGGHHRVKEPSLEPVVEGTCKSCRTINETDARFCKQCGVKLGAALLLIGALLVPALAIAQPDLRMMAGIPRPDGTLADGTITVRVVRESLANNVTGHPVELRAGDQVLTAKTDGNGRATFRAPAAGTIVRAATVVDGERLESQEFPSPARGGVAVMLVAGLGVAAPQQAAQSGSVSLGPQSRFVVDLVDDNVQVYYLLEIINPASYPVNPPKPVIFDLPSGAGGAGSLNDDSPQVVVRTDRVIVTAPFAPGTTAMQIGFTMRYSGGELTISQKLPVTLAAANVVMRKLGEMDLVSPQFNNQQERMIQGERYVMAEGPPIPADGTLTFNLTGLPHHSRMPLTVTALLTGIIVLVGMWAAVSTPPDRGAAEARRRQLESRREKAFGELMKLEEQRRTGRMDPARHQSRRATLVAQLERIYGELDHQGPAGGDEGLAA